MLITPCGCLVALRQKGGSCCGNRGKPNSLSGRCREWAWTTVWAAHGQSKKRFAHTLPTQLPTPIPGRPLNSLRFTTVPTTLLLLNCKQASAERQIQKERNLCFLYTKVAQFKWPFLDQNY
jgi:hypothetical protein